MTQDPQATGGAPDATNGPAPSRQADLPNDPTGPDDQETFARNLLHTQLQEGNALVIECARIAFDPVQTSSAQLYAASAAAKLMSAVSQAATALARIYDVETKRYIANNQVRGYLPAPRRR